MLAERGGVGLQNRIEEGSGLRSEISMDATVQAKVAIKLIIKAMLRPSTIR